VVGRDADAAEGVSENVMVPETSSVIVIGRGRGDKKRDRRRKGCGRSEKRW
jgi:hypothetical protein